MGDPLQEAREALHAAHADLSILHDRMAFRDSENPAVAKAYAYARLKFFAACETFNDACHQAGLKLPEGIE